LVAAVREVANGQMVVSPKLRDALLRNLRRDRPVASKDPASVLSEREMGVFELTGQGLEAKEIAERFSISPRTVDVHRANIRNKLGIQGAHELMRYALLWTGRRQEAERMRAFARNASPLLLVEDDEVDILNVDRALQELNTGTELLVARTAEEALTRLRAPDGPRPGLLLLDLKMPGMDGHEFLKAVRQDARLRSLPVVVLTGSQLEEDRQQMYSLGITGYVTKPATPAEFIQRLGLLARYWSVNEPPPRNTLATAGQG
jgi:DNA-binding NarL/FixJ family response regulator